eukprot:scaffold165380_cov24-Tisochrysis_lutea.AAC.5
MHHQRHNAPPKGTMHLEASQQRAQSHLMHLKALQQRAQPHLVPLQALQQSTQPHPVFSQDLVNPCTIMSVHGLASLGPVRLPKS